MKPQSLTIVTVGGRIKYNLEEGLNEVAYKYERIWVVKNKHELCHRTYEPDSDWYNPYNLYGFGIPLQNFVLHEGLPAYYDGRIDRYYQYRGSCFVLDECDNLIPKWKLRELLVQDGRFESYRIGVFECFREKYRPRGRRWRYRRGPSRHNPRIQQEYRNICATEVDPEYREYKIKIRRSRNDLPLYFWFNDDNPYDGRPKRSWKNYRKTQYRLTKKS